MSERERICKILYYLLDKRSRTLADFMRYLVFFMLISSWMIAYSALLHELNIWYHSQAHTWFDMIYELKSYVNDLSSKKMVVLLTLWAQLRSCIRLAEKYLVGYLMGRIESISDRGACRDTARTDQKP